VDWVCRTHGRDEKFIQNFGRKARRKRPLGIPRCRCEVNIRVILGQ
jgi:hypothetical protein